MYVPFLTVCVLTKTYNTNLTKITKHINKIKYVVDNVTYFVKNDIHDCKYSKECKGVDINLEILDLTDIAINTVCGLKLTKLLLSRINIIYDISVDTLDISATDSIEMIYKVKMKTFIPCEFIGSLYYITMDTLDLSSVSHIRRIHHVKLNKFIPCKKIDYLYNISIPKLDLSKAERVSEIYKIFTKTFIGCKNMKYIYKITIKKLDLSTTKNMIEISNIVADKIISPTNRVHCIQNVESKLLDLSNVDHVDKIKHIVVKKVIAAKSIGEIYDSEIQTIDTSLNDGINSINIVGHNS